MNIIFARRYDRLEQEKKALIASLEGFSEEILNRKPSPGAWSGIQVVHHLIKSESGIAQYLAKKVPHAADAASAGAKAYARYLLVVFFLKSTFLKRKAPAGIGENLPEHDTLANTLALWDAARAALRAQVEAVPDAQVGKELFNHPFAGKMSLAQTLGFMAAHVERHRGQIERTLHVVQ